MKIVTFQAFDALKSLINNEGYRYWSLNYIRIMVRESIGQKDYYKLLK